MPLEPSDLAALSRLLDQALDLEPSQVEPWLDALPQQHRHLVPHLRDMLGEHMRAAAAAFLSSGPKLDDRADALSAAAGSMVGPYRLIREIGRGGMGLVWLAERADGSFKRQVALKLPRLVWGAGLAERMARERDIGALLEHPNIARLYDAGVDSLGRPYLALEYIDGQAIDAWCEAQALTVQARLRLFLQVARAVAYAHGRLVVHRDLKPSNVLVTGDGQTHLLDFGIAKLLDDAADSQGGLTQEQGRVLTPHYASPEQLRGQAITVRSDVYSLGVLLFELLTARVPYDTSGKGLAELERAMLQRDAALASSRAEDKVVARALRGEIDAILAKALQRESALRYATADALADEIERHLNGERVLAQSDRALYRVAKAVRRHRVLFAAVGAVTLAVLGGAGFSIAQAKRATEAAERARVVKEFVVDVFKVNERGNPANAELRQVPVEVLLERGAKLIETKFAGDIKLQAELYGVVAGIFADMGASAQAETYARRHVTALEGASGSRDERSRGWTLVAEALEAQDQLPGAEQAARTALESATTASDAAIAARLSLVDILARQSRDTEAMTELDRVDAELRGRAQQASLLAAKALDKRAFLLNFQGDFDAALPMYERAIDMAIATDGRLSRVALSARLFLARRFIHRAEFQRAKAYMTAGLAALRERGGVDEFVAAVSQALLTTELSFAGAISIDEAITTVARLESELAAKPQQVPAVTLARVRLNAGALYLNWGDMERAHALIEPAVGTLKAAWSANPWGMQMTSMILGSVKMYRGEHREADALFGESLDWGRRARRFDLSQVFLYRVSNLDMQGRFDEAEAELDAIVASKTASEKPAQPLPDDESIALARAELKLDRGDPAAALALIPESSSRDESNDYDNPRMVRGAALCAAGQVRQGLAMIETHVNILAPNHYPYDPRLAYWRALAGLCALRAGSRQRATEFFRLSRAAFVEQPNISPSLKAPHFELATRLGEQAAGAK